MKIVILDGFAANPGDISWEGLKALGECTIYDRTAPEEVLERSAGAEVILTNKVIINADHMAALPELKYIGVLATGYNVVDTAAAKERGIIVTNIPAYSTASVAQMVFAYLPTSTAPFGRSPQRSLDKQQGFLFLGYSFNGTERQENRFGRTGKYRLHNCSCCYRFRYAGLCTDFQVTLPVAAGNQENGLRPTVQRM